LRGKASGPKSNRRVSQEEVDRLKYVFSDTVIIPKERLDLAKEKWRGALIEKFLGRKMDSDFIGKALAHK